MNLQDVPRNHTQFLKLVRERIIERRDVYVCHAITSVAEQALKALREASDVERHEAYAPCEYWLLSQAMELYHAVQMAINYRPNGLGQTLGTFDQAYDSAHPEEACEGVCYPRKRIEWLTRSIEGGDDRGTVRNIINSRYPSYHATDEQLAAWQLEN